jgi:hypothetical protein
MSPLAWRAYLGAGALAAGVVLALPVAPRAVLLVAVGASAALAIAAGVRGHRPAGGGAWWLLAAGQGLFVLGDVLFTVNDLVLHIEPFPSLADALYLAGYPVLAGGLALLLRRRSATRDRPALLDAAIIATGFGLISWVLVVVPYFRDLEQTLLELVVSLAYPVGDALLLALAAALAVAAGRRTTAYWLLVGNLVADTGFSVLALRGADTGPADVGYVVAYALLGATALHPSMVGLSEPAEERRARLGVDRLAMGAGGAGAAGRPAAAGQQGRRRAPRRADPAAHRARLRAGARQAAAAPRQPAGGDQAARARPGRAVGRGAGPAPADGVAAAAEAGSWRRWSTASPGGAAQRGQARPGGTAVARPGGDRRARAPGDPRRRGRLPAGAELGAGPRRPLRPAGMRERVEIAGGSWQVHARPGGGVTIRARFRTRSAA